MFRKTEGYKDLNANIRTKYASMDIDNNTDGSGVVPSSLLSTVEAVEFGNGQFRQTVLKLKGVSLVVRDTEQGGGINIYTFPKGRITMLGAVASIAVTTKTVLADTLNAESTCNWGIGTITQANSTVANAQQDLVNVAAFTSSAVINEAGPVANGSGVGIVTSFDGTSTPITAFLNLAVADGEDIDGNATVTVTGEVRLSYVVL